MSQDFEIPPMGADNLPLKEMETAVPSVAKPPVLESATAQKKNPKIILIMVLIVSFALILGLMLGTSLKPGKVSTTKPSASPVAVSSSEVSQSSKEPQNTKERLDNLSTKIEETDFKEQSLQPPIVDFQIRFELKQ